MANATDAIRSAAVKAMHEAHGDISTSIKIFVQLEPDLGYGAFGFSSALVRAL